MKAFSTFPRSLELDSHDQTQFNAILGTPFFGWRGLDLLLGILSAYSQPHRQGILCQQFRALIPYLHLCLVVFFKGANMKNRPHLITIQASILVCQWTFRPVLVSVIYPSNRKQGCLTVDIDKYYCTLLSTPTLFLCGKLHFIQNQLSQHHII